MKGTLTKKINGTWVVRVQSTDQHPSPSVVEYGVEYPLHPDDVLDVEQHIEATSISHSLNANMEVEFEIAHLSRDPLGRDVKTYAKLINQVPDVRKMVEDDVKTTTSDLIDSAIWSLPFEERMKCWKLIEKLVEEEKETLYTEEQVKLAYMQGYNRGKDGNPDHMESYIEFLKQPKQ